MKRIQLNRRITISDLSSLNANKGKLLLEAEESLKGKHQFLNQKSKAKDFFDKAISAIIILKKRTWIINM